MGEVRECQRSRLHRLSHDLGVPHQGKIDESEEGYYIVAEIVNILVDENYLAEDGKPDIEKMELIVFDPIHHGYIELGKTIGTAFSDGKALNSITI